MADTLCFRVQLCATVLSFLEVVIVVKMYSLHCKKNNFRRHLMLATVMWLICFYRTTQFAGLFIAGWFRSFEASVADPKGQHETQS